MKKRILKKKFKETLKRLKELEDKVNQLYIKAINNLV